MSLARCGDHTGLVYSKIGRARVLYKIEKISLFSLPTVHLSKPSTLFALSLEKACGEGEGRKGHDVIITVTF